MYIRSCGSVAALLGGYRVGLLGGFCGQSLRAFYTGLVFLGATGSRSLRDARFKVDPMPLALVGLIIFDISCPLRMGRLWASLS